MFRILDTGDLHLTERSRWSEATRILNWVLEQLFEHKPDALGINGDLYDAASTPRERMYLASFVNEAARICPVLIAKGNHDRPQDCALLAKLRSDHPIIVEEAAAVHRVGEAAIAVVAWPDPASLAAYTRTLRGGRDRAFGLEVETLSLQAVLRGLGAELAQHDGPRIALGHFMVDGAVVSTGQPLLGQPMRVGLADLDLLNADVVLMSHIHKPQDWTYNERPIIYAGSPYRTSYGELEPKSIVLVEVDKRDVVWTRLPSPCAGMVLVDDEWAYDFLAGEHAWQAGRRSVPPKEELEGAEVRFRYAVEPDQRDPARAAAHRLRDSWLAAGAAQVKVEECVRTTARARAPEVAKAQTLPDKLHALWNARNTTPETARAERLCQLAVELENE